MTRKSIYNLLIYRLHDKALKRAASKYFNGKMLDIGCGIKPYFEMMRPYVTTHIGVDHKDSPHSNENVDLIGTAYKIPVNDSLFDSALCTSVLEHLEDPELALAECNRILKTGGIAIYTVPFIWHLHEEPRDFYRFSKFGLHYIFTKTGFELIEINALSGFWGTFGQLFTYNLYRCNRGPLRWFKIIDMLALVLQGIFLIMDHLDKTEQWTSLYLVVAKKK